MKKAVALLMALTMSVTALAGCSGGESSKKDEEKSSFKEQAKGEKDLSGKVVYWSMYNEGEPEAVAIQKAAEMFMEDYPECEVEKGENGSKAHWEL